MVFHTDRIKNLIIKDGQVIGWAEDVVSRVPTKGSRVEGSLVVSVEPGEEVVENPELVERLKNPKDKLKPSDLEVVGGVVREKKPKG